MLIVLKPKTPTKVYLRLSFHEIHMIHNNHLQSHTQSVDRIIILFPDGIIRNNLSLWGNSLRKSLKESLKEGVDFSTPSLKAV